jgi:hypothetical protein
MYGFFQILFYDRMRKAVEIISADIFRPPKFARIPANPGNQKSTIICFKFIHSSSEIHGWNID